MPEGPPQSNRTATTAENVIFRILKSCRNRGSHFLQFTGLWLNCGKSTTLLQLRSIKFDCVDFAPQLVTVRGHPTKLQTHPVQLGQIANRRPIDHRKDCLKLSIQAQFWRIEMGTMCLYNFVTILDPARTR